jgi:large subunit ribosomal protein L10
MNRNQKQELIDELHADFEKAAHAVLIDYRGLSVPAATEFRRKIRASGGRYRVVKNSLALRAAKGTAFEKLIEHFDEMTGVAYTDADPVALAKVVVDFAKDEPAIQTRAGLVEREQVLDPAGIKALSEMPSLPELRSMLLGLLQQPATTLVRLLGTPATQLARVLGEREKKLGGGAQA